MPGPGERIGDAYIRVHASGGDIGKEIEKELDDADRVLSRKGREHGDKYTKELTRTMASRGWTKKAAAEIVRDISHETSVRAGQVNTAFFKSLRESLHEAEGEDVGERMFLEIRRGFEKDTKGLIIKTDVEEGPLDRLEERLRREYPALVERAENEVLDINRRYAREREALEKDQTRKLEQEQRFRENAVRLAAERQARYWDQTWNEAIRMNKEFNKQLQDGHRTTQRQFERSRFIQVFRDDVDRLSDSIGRGFGKGSRSEFLNFFGRLAGNMTRLATLPIRAGLGFFELGRAIAFSAKEGAGFFGSIIGGFRLMGVTLPKVIAGLAAVPIAMGVLIAVIGPLIAGISLLLGVVTALASTLTYGLIAAVSSLAAILVPLAGLALGAGAAFATMDKQAKAFLKNSFAPVGAAFKDIGAAARRELFPVLPEVGRRLGKVTSGFKEMARESGRAIGLVALDFARSMQSPGFRQWRDAFTSFMPGAIIRLGDIARQTLGGFGGLFQGMIPFMNRVLDYLDKLTFRFQEWANSPKGQNAIKQFFEDAGDSASRLGGFLKQVGGLVKDLFTAGRGTGDSLFESMERNIRQFRNYIKSDPDILRNWFASAQRFGEALGDAVIGAGKLMAALDSPGARLAITGLVKGIGLIGSTMAIAVSIAQQAFGQLIGGIGVALRGIAEVAERFHIPGASGLKDAANNLVEIGQNSQAAATQMLNLGDAAANASETGKAKMKELGNSVNETANNILISRAKLNEFKNVLSTMPTELVTRITTDGSIANTKKEILALARQYDLTPKQVRTLVEMTGGKVTKAELKDILARLEETDNFRGNPTIDSSSIKNAGKSADTTSDKIIRIPKNPKVKLSQSGFDRVIELAQRAADMIRNIKSKKVYIDTVFRKRGGPANPTIEAMGGIMDAFGDVHRVLPRTVFAAGGIANFAQNRGNSLIAESGREAIVPLDRPLSQIDPSVRALAAFAQGINQNGPGTRVGVDASGWTIVAPAADPAAVANKVIDRLTAASY